MTDYNDGKWHGWNGGECPVHPKSEVDVVFVNSFGELMRDTRKSSGHMWNAPDFKKAETIAFRVTKPYIEPPKPREFWVKKECVGSQSYINGDIVRLYEYRECDKEAPDAIHVREVLE